MVNSMYHVFGGIIRENRTNLNTFLFDHRKKKRKKKIDFIVSSTHPTMESKKENV